MSCSSPLSMFTKVILTTIDFINSVEAINNFDEDDLDLISHAQVVNKLVLFGYSTLDIAGYLFGLKSQTVLKLKAFEILPRTIQVPLSAINELKKLDGDLTFQEGLRALEQGIVSPLSDLVRVTAECAYQYEKRFLLMSPEKLKNAKRITFEREKGDLLKVSYRPIDLKECEINANTYQRIAKIGSGVRIASFLNVGELSLLTGEKLYEFLAKWIQNQNPQPTVQIPQQNVQIQLAFSLLSLSYIPDPLHGDRVFSQYKCPINQAPIRHAIRDPNGRTLYERSSIMTWLSISQISPVTGRPLRIRDLQETPAVQALIDQRLQYHQDNLWSYLERSAGLRRGLAGAAPANLVAAAETEHPQ